MMESHFKLCSFILFLCMPLCTFARRLDDLEGEVAAMGNQVNAQQEQLANVSSEVEALKTEILQLKGKPVVFSATSPTREAFGGYYITFNTITTNLGGGYNKATGIFTCPVAGVYQFSLTVLTDVEGKNVHCRIIQNEVWKGLAVSNMSQYSSHTVIVNSVLQLNDKVYVGQCGHWDYVSVTNGRTVFNGVLIKAI